MGGKMSVHWWGNYDVTGVEVLQHDELATISN